MTQRAGAAATFRPDALADDWTRRHSGRACALPKTTQGYARLGSGSGQADVQDRAATFGCRCEHPSGWHRPSRAGCVQSGRYLCKPWLVRRSPCPGEPGLREVGGAHRNSVGIQFGGRQLGRRVRVIVQHNSHKRRGMAVRGPQRDGRYPEVERPATAHRACSSSGSASRGSAVNASSTGCDRSGIVSLTGRCRRCRSAPPRAFSGGAACARIHSHLRV